MNTGNLKAERQSSTTSTTTSTSSSNFGIYELIVRDSAAASDLHANPLPRVAEFI
jgi:hypothetical protein